MRACGRSLLLCVFVPIAALFDSERRRFRPAQQTARALKLLFALFVLQAFESFAAPCIWFADANSVKQINTDDNSIVVEVPMPAPRRLVMNDNDCSVWALRQSDRRLIKLDAAGSQVGNVDVTLLDPGLTAALRVRLDPFDNSLWVTDTRHVSHFNADATVLLGSFTTPADIKRLRIGMDQKLWVLGKRKLWRYNRQGKQLEERALDPVLLGEASHFAVDELRGTIWIAGGLQIARLDANVAGPPNFITQVPTTITALALDPITGFLWYGQSGVLEALHPAGFVTVSLSFAAVGPNRLAFDPASRSVWVGFDQYLLRFSEFGSTLAVLPSVDYDDEALGVPPFIVKPRLALDRPPENGVVNRPKPPIKLEYKSRCNGQACDLVGSYLSGLQLTATLNGVSIGPQFVFDGSSTATYNPPTRLPDGVSSFSARVTDVFGHKSNAIDTTFTIDTVPPQFGAFSPPSGSVVAVPLVTLQGTVSEARSTVLVENGQLFNPQGPNPQFPQLPGLGFSWGLTLFPGYNPIQLTAIDAAGNTTSLVHSLILSGGATQASIQSPVNGATIPDNSVIVTGTWSGALNTGVVVNGVVASISGNQFFANVPLTPGTNILTATATSPDGSAAAQSVTVTGAVSAPIRVVASRQTGIAPLLVNFSVSNTSTKTISSVTADFDGTGFNFVTTTPDQPFGFTYTAARAYVATFVIADSSGATTTQQITINPQDFATADFTLRATYNGMLFRLKSGDIPGALSAVTGSAHDKYLAVFNALGPNLSAAVDQLGTMQPSFIGEGIAEYAVTRTSPGNGTQAFLIYFLRGTDGVWRIDGM